MIWLIFWLICLADHGSFQIQWSLVTLYMWSRKADNHKAPKDNQTWFRYEWTNWSTEFENLILNNLNDFYDFMILNGFELTI